LTNASLFYKIYSQAISRRIHYGKFVAEAKFRESPRDYEPLIRAKVYSDLVHKKKIKTNRNIFAIFLDIVLLSFFKCKTWFFMLLLRFGVKIETVNGLFLQDRKALMKLLTSKNVEEIVVKRVEKKAMVFGQEVSLDHDVKGHYKVDPAIVSRLYKEWIIPMTKNVELEYLLRRLD
jgi:hypothetical protein